jgi:DNA-binding transcriptional ArsR family regulator
MLADRLTSTFAALADPTRRAILTRLMTGEASVTALAAPFEMSMPAVTKHLKVLENAGLITRGRAAQWRPCRIQGAALREAADCIQQYRHAWEKKLDRLQGYLNERKARGKPK